MGHKTKRKTVAKRRPQLLTSSLSGPAAKPIFLLCEHKDKSWIHGFFKSPWSSILIFPPAAVYSLSPFPESAFPWGRASGSPAAPPLWSQGSQPNGGGGGRGSRADTEEPCCLPSRGKSKGRISRLWANSKDSSLDNLCLGPILVTFWPNGKIISPFLELCPHWARLCIHSTLWFIRNSDRTFILGGGQCRELGVRKLGW